MRICSVSVWPNKSQQGMELECVTMEALPQIADFLLPRVNNRVCRGESEIQMTAGYIHAYSDREFNKNY